MQGLREKNSVNYMGDLCDNRHVNEYGDSIYLKSFAPAIVFFAEYVLNDAALNNLDRLYFLSRDGYQMYIAAKELAKYKGLDIECRYLNVSRYAMRVPGYALDMDRAIDSICGGGVDVTIDKILNRGALTADECEIVKNELGLKAESGVILNNAQLSAMKKRLSECETLRKYMKRHSEEAFQTAVDYLEQEGLCRDDRFALVDSGWVGTLQISIESLVRVKNPDISVKGYYFGMYEYPAGADINAFKTFYFSPKHGIARKMRFSNSLFETVVSAPEGMTVGYKRNDETDRIEPVLLESGNPNSLNIEKNIENLRVYIEAYTHKDYGRNVPEVSGIDSAKFSKTTKSNGACIYIENSLGTLMSQPTEEDYICFNDWKFSDDINDSAYKNVAAKLSIAEIRRQYFWSRLLINLGLKKGTILESAWMEGSIVEAVRDKAVENLSGRIKKELRHVRFYKWMVFFRKQLKSYL